MTLDMPPPAPFDRFSAAVAQLIQVENVQKTPAPPATPMHESRRTRRKLSRLRKKAILLKAQLYAAKEDLARRSRELRTMVDGLGWSVLLEADFATFWRKLCRANTRFYGVFKVSLDASELFKVIDNNVNMLRNMKDLCDKCSQRGYSLACAPDVEAEIRRVESFRDSIRARWPLTYDEFRHCFPVDAEEVVSISPLAYIRTILALAWGAFRYPFRATVIDLSTGEAVHVPAPEGRAYFARLQDE